MFEVDAFVILGFSTRSSWSHKDTFVKQKSFLVCDPHCEKV